MKKYFISILILFTLSFSDIIAPENGASLNTTHILFEWEQVPDAVSYRITWVYGNNPEMLLGEEYTESLIYINTEIFPPPHAHKRNKIDPRKSTPNVKSYHD